MSTYRVYDETPPFACESEKSNAGLLRVFILSDVRLYREGLGWSLSRRSDIEVVGASAPDACTLAEIARSAPAAVVLDVTMAGALNLSRELARLAPGAKVIAFAVSQIEHELIACAEAGVAGYVSRDGSIDDIVKAIRSALCGEFVCSPRLGGLLLQRVAALSPAIPGPHDEPMLTRREYEILELINQGQSNKEIARSLRIGSATVKNHVHNILAKLQVKRRGEAAARLRGKNLSTRIPCQASARKR